MYWTGAAQAATGALQHLRGASVRASAAIAHSDPRHHINHNCHILSPAVAERCVLQTLCEFHFHLSLRALILNQSSLWKGSCPVWFVSAFWHHATCVMLKSAAAYHHVTILVSRFIFYTQRPVPPCQRMLLCCVSTVAQTDGWKWII